MGRDLYRVDDAATGKILSFMESEEDVQSQLI